MCAHVCTRMYGGLSTCIEARSLTKCEARCFRVQIAILLRGPLSPPLVSLCWNYGETVKSTNLYSFYGASGDLNSNPRT